MKKTLLSLMFFISVLGAWAQCPRVYCPANITVGSDPGVCGAVVNTPVTGIDSCAPNVNETFNYTGSVQFWVVPQGVASVTVTADGAEGATSANPNGGNGNGGLGGTATGNLSVTPGDTLWIYVGGQGQQTTQGNSGGGGFNGGGDGAAGYTGIGWLGGGGGGASDIRVGGQALTNRVIVGAGGGGGGSNCSTPNGNAAGDGGGTTGGAGISCTSAGFGNGGTQTAGGVANAYGWDCGSGVAGANGALGVGGAADVCSAGGGGGGGYYGGAGGDFGGGGGGSSYIGGVTGGSTTAASNTGHGQVTITSSGNPVTLTQIAGIASGNQFPVGTTTNTYVASGTGPNDTCSFTVTVIDSGVATVLGPLSQDTICTSAGMLTLPAGTPAGGTYSGTGVTGNSFDPAVAQLGNHWIYYTDTVACQNADSVLITVVWCTGIEEGALSDIVKISPNPSNGLFQLAIPQGEYFEKLELFDASGRKVWLANDPKNTMELDLRNKADGLYMLHVGMKGQSQVFKLIKK